ncbi:MAG: hypothetical protein CM15mP74_23790 [Halieaceae bacterium]|nr:MAG: hypothetical protein CM15mP74_23790 [Halieaceae bacterium]
MSDAQEERAEVTPCCQRYRVFSVRVGQSLHHAYRSQNQLSLDECWAGRDMETLLREVRRADEQLHTGDSEDASEPAD